MHPLFASISDWDIDSNLFAQAQAEFGKLASVWDCWFDSAYSEDYGIADYGFLSWVGGRVTSISSVQGDYCQMQKSIKLLLLNVCLKFFVAKFYGSELDSLSTISN